jgi:hypothetical protein
LCDRKTAFVRSRFAPCQANLRAVLALAAELRGTPEAQLAQLAWDNSRRLFRVCLDAAEQLA